jgi:preprotein translocase subunit Sec63
MQSEPGSSSIEEILKIISTAKAKDDPFAILGINPDATEQEIRRSYRYLIFD